MLRTEMQSRIENLSIPTQVVAFLGSLTLFHFAQLASKALLAALLAVFVVMHLLRTHLAEREALLNDRMEAGQAVPHLNVVRPLTVAASGLENIALGALMAYVILAVFRFL